MKATLTIPEKDTTIELDNITLTQFRMIGERPSDESPMLTEKYSIGEPIVLITSNMPDELKNDTSTRIAQFCNH